MWQIEFYETEAGRSPVLEWIEDMTEEEAALAWGTLNSCASWERRRGCPW
jgi:hypothetical protein